MSKISVLPDSGLAPTMPFNRRHLLGLAGAMALSTLAACGGGGEEAAVVDVVPEPSGQDVIPEPQVSTLAGSGDIGSADGVGAAASFNNPTGVAVDAAGFVYVADRHNFKIRKISPSGEVSTFAGSGERDYVDGLGEEAAFRKPTGLAFDAVGNLYVTDTNNHRIRMVTPEGLVSTVAGSGQIAFADGTGSAAAFNYPASLAVSPEGNVIVADTANHRIRKVTPQGVVTTLAGTGVEGGADGNALEATFRYPTGVAVDGAGNVYVADFGNNKFRKISPAGEVSTLAGAGTLGNQDGEAAVSEFIGVAAVAVSNDGRLFLLDGGNHKIRVMGPDGLVSTFAGTGAVGSADGNLLEASFFTPSGLTIDAAGVIYVADTSNQKIRKIG